MLIRGGILDIEEILRTALKLEEKAIEFYSKMAEKSDDPEVKELLELLISQEVEHKKMISDRLKAIEFLKRR